MWRAVHLIARSTALIATCAIASACTQSNAANESGAPGDDSAAYDRYRRPELLVSALALKTGDTVADVGAGRGYLTFRLADAVGLSGHVVATDIDTRVLESITAHHLANVETRQVTKSDPGLEPTHFDLILLSEVDSYLLDRADYFARLAHALKKGGRLAVSNRLPYRAAVSLAAAQAGLRITGESTDLPGQFMLFFEATTQ